MSHLSSDGITFLLRLWKALPLEELLNLGHRTFVKLRFTFVWEYASLHNMGNSLLWCELM